MVYSDGSSYDGTFVKGRRDGKGTHVTIEADGKESKYSGDWVDNTIQGRGVATFSNGNVYEGDFSKGKIEGEGTLTTLMGDKYEGSWR
eukprot:CAMPEP_0118638570 /NCGR_PEP_ID=MMETSP0785-20121206/3760_1 /TAXON_ID=91992 /ORGANISM="Bolidomonas pacifica, Strain CCMP 1866" /LENGTH=87 /DNA_ID=CAMNT_0006529839 /DNA_START=6 /DNA_END=266 /DNA_ORIENTATION=-